MTSNMSKNFKMKSKLRGMADGGSVADYMSGKSREQQLKEASGEWKPAAAPKAGQPDFRNVQAKVTTSYEEKKKSALQRLFGMKDGGTPPTRRGKGTVDDFPATEYDFHGGSVEGPGGPTDDKVGPVKLSNKEYVLPADTVAAIGVDKLEALRAATHNFDSTEDAEGLAGGGVVDWIKNTAGEVASKLRGAAAPASAPTAPVTPAASAAPIRPAFAPGGTQVMGEAGRASARAAAYEAAGNPLGAARVGAAAPSAAPGVATVAENAAAKAGLASRVGGMAGTALRDAATVALPAAAAYNYFKDDPAAREAAGGGPNVPGYIGGRVGELGRAGSYLLSAATIGGVSPQDWGGMMSNLRGDGRAMQDSTPANQRGWLRRGMDSVMGIQAPQQGGGNTVASEGGTGIFPPGYGGGPDEGLLDTRSMRERGIASIRGGLPNMSGIPDSSPVITGGDPDSQYNQHGADEVIGSFNGRPITKGEADARAGRLQTASFMPPAKQSDPMQDALISALRGGGGGGGFSAPSSNARDINARFDSLAKNLEGRYGSKGQGNLAHRLLELEGMRANALDADARNMSSLRGQDMTAASNAASNRVQAAQVAAGLLRDRDAALAAGSKATADAQAKAQEMATKAEETGYKRMTDAVGGWFTGADGKPDTGEQERFMSYIQNSAPEAYTKLTSMPAQDQMQVLQMFKTQYDMDKTRNSTAAGGLIDHGVQVNRATTPTELREAAFSDVFNKHLPFKDYLYSNIPFFTNKNVVVDNTGQATLLSDLGTTNGQWDAEKMAIIDRLAKKSKE